MLSQRDIYKYCPYCGTEFERRAGHFACPGCGRQHFFNAKACVGVLLTNDKKEALLVKRAREPFKDWWDIPGGFVEEQETLEEAARRELKEETGLEVAELRYEGSVWEDYHFRDEVIPIVGAIFSGRVPDDAKVRVADDVNGYKFVPKDQVDIAKIAFPNQRQFLKKLLARS